MSTTDPAITLILAEFSILIFTALIFLLLGMLLKKRKQSRKLSQMLERATSNEATRKQSLNDIFSISSSDDKPINGIVDEIYSSEITLLKLISSAFICNKTDFIENLDTEIYKLIEPCRLLASSKTNTESSNSNSSEDSMFDDAIGDLIADDNQRKPEFDLSTNESISDDSASDTQNIAEIPASLLSEDNGNSVEPSNTN